MDSLTYLSKVNLIEDDLIGMADSPESSEEGEGGDGSKTKLVITLSPDRTSLLRSLCKLVEFSFRSKDRRVGALLGGHVPLPQAALRRGTSSHDDEALIQNW